MVLNHSAPDYSLKPKFNNFNRHKSQLVDSSVPKRVPLKTSNVFTSNLQIFYQNIRGLQNKIDELLLSWDSNSPHIICFSEHHLHKDQIQHLFINECKHVASYCRSSHKHGGVCIFIQESLSCSTIDLRDFCQECIIDACALKLDFNSINLCVLVIYRSPSGDFSQFLYSFGNILNHVYNNYTNIIICSDFNVNYLETKKKITSIGLSTSFI